MTEPLSLRNHVLKEIGSFLYNEKFPKIDCLAEGILDLINLTSSYREEGEELYPEIFLTNNIDSVLKTLPFVKRVEVSSKPTCINEFKNALKLCAPLSRNGWIIYINITEEIISFGLVSSEISELSPTFKKQVVGELGANKNEYSIAYLQNVGNKSVLLQGSETQSLVCLTLDSSPSEYGSKLNTLCKYITKDIQDEQGISKGYFEKIIGKALISGHGSLIGIIKNATENIQALKEKHSDGIYLSNPIDLHESLLTSEQEKSSQASTSNLLFSSLLGSMLSHDGITILTTTGEILGYHVFIKSNETNNDLPHDGGARSRAFKAMTESNDFECCFYKSQDGNEKVWSAHHDK